MNKKAYAIKVAKKAKEEAKKNMIRLIKVGIVTAAAVRPYIKEAAKEIRKELNMIAKTAKKEAEKEMKAKKKATKKKRR